MSLITRIHHLLAQGHEPPAIMQALRDAGTDPAAISFAFIVVGIDQLVEADRNVGMALLVDLHDHAAAELARLRALH